MSTAAVRRGNEETRTIAFFVIASFFAISLVSGLARQFTGLPAALDAAQPHLAFFIHLAFTIHRGGLYGRRCVTWLLLVLGTFAVQLGLFAGYIFPLGQFEFWLATRPELYRVLQPLLDLHLWPLVGLVLPGLLALDLWMAHRGDGWRRVVPWGLAAIAAGHVVLAVLEPRPCAVPDVFASVDQLRETVECNAAASASTPFPSSPTTPFAAPVHIVPEWHLLPGYAVLRAVPGKTAGVAALFALLLLPALAIWFRADRLRAGRAAGVWFAACLGLYTACIGLGWLGTQPAEAGVLLLSRGLAIYVFAFFLLPFALRRYR